MIMVLMVQKMKRKGTQITNLLCRNYSATSTTTTTNREIHL